MSNKKLVSWLLISILSISALHVAFRIASESEGGLRENSDSHILISALETEFPTLLSGEDRIFYRTRRDVIRLEIHDVLGKSDQEKILASVRAKLDKKAFTETIEISFHPRFLLEKKELGNGRWSGEVIKTNPTRQETLTPK